MIKSTFLSIKSLTKTYHLLVKPVVENICLELNLGTSLSIQGPSGKGKSTLLYMMGLLDKPSSGQYFLNHINVLELNRSQQAKIRSQYFGFIFQEHRLIPYLSVQENIRLPFVYAKNNIDLKWESYLLNTLELADLTTRFPHELSLGQQQRVAIARGFITRPKIILADEPTASLDRKLAETYMAFSLEYVKENQALYVMVTHDKELANKAQHQFYL